ncbi:hypothetical protein J4207_03955 [Candidatus Woesearchaeota archaeon]|nr:hypothetical protein [Candidatus Woesearchaeota archaeon]
MKVIDFFKDLFNKVLKNEINVKKFDKDFNAAFFNDTFMEPISRAEFHIIDELWGYLEFYEPNKRKRESWEMLIDEKKVLRRVKIALNKLKKLERQVKK